jgi:hypothetical protein
MNEIDRELLEKAAKAADVGLFFRDGEPGDSATGCPWNPLADDGDALRLATKLGMVLDVRYTDPAAMKFNRVNYWLPGKGSYPYSHVGFELDTELCASTRRAITRAAAFIGEKK